MPTLTIDGQSIEAQPGQMILQAAVDAGVEIPHYCYHPGLSIVASCRICLAEVEGVPKLLPTCQTPVRDGMVVHTNSPRSVANQKQVMEYLLINHPLDCPVCDQSGECYLQDYSYQYGRSQSRFEEDKIKQPKKIVGEHVLLYGDRCIMCTRCVRFTREVSGGAELMVEGRGHQEQINIFPGRPLDDNLSGNVVDLCPVGALLDRDFLFKQRVWLLKSARSISPADAGGENIYLQHNEGAIYRVKPRYNADVNDWWISNDTRYSYKALYADNRIRNAAAKTHGILEPVTPADALDRARRGLQAAHAGDGTLYAVLSPMMTCEEAHLLVEWVRSVDSQALLVTGPVPEAAGDEVYHHYDTGEETFRVSKEKVPNRRGVQRVIDAAGGPSGTWADLLAGSRDDVVRLKGGWVVGGYLSAWAGEVPAVMRDGFVVLHDLLATDVADAADVVLPAAAWAEKHGCWENKDGRVQPFEAAVEPPAGVRPELDVFAELLGREATAASVRESMGQAFADVGFPAETADAASPFEFAEL